MICNHKNSYISRVSYHNTVSVCRDCHAETQIYEKNPTIKPANGWTKKTVIAQIEKEFTFKSICGFSCAYRGFKTGDGIQTKCAIGCFIPDGAYKTEMEGNNVEALSRRYPSLLRHFPFESIEVLIQFQKIHDSSSDRENIKEKLISWVETNVI